MLKAVAAILLQCVQQTGERRTKSLFYFEGIHHPEKTPQCEYFMQGMA
jgi:hypothetical protein